MWHLQRVGIYHKFIEFSINSSFNQCQKDQKLKRGANFGPINLITDTTKEIVSIIQGFELLDEDTTFVKSICKQNSKTKTEN
ncbi:hypothetical protein TanjilG_16878 [Lupinus angustifolius]|nr:hypothetical protein TanjilG_16878 [Lupinus angustifolius]